MKYTIPYFKDKPTTKDIRKAIEYHDTFTDYCRVWLNNGVVQEYENNIPVVQHLYNRNMEPYYIIEFVNKTLYPEGSFGKLGVIRSKRRIEKRVE